MKPAAATPVIIPMFGASVSGAACLSYNTTQKMFSVAVQNLLAQLTTRLSKIRAICEALFSRRSLLSEAHLLLKVKVKVLHTQMHFFVVKHFCGYNIYLVQLLKATTFNLVSCKSVTSPCPYLASKRSRPTRRQTRART